MNAWLPFERCVQCDAAEDLLVRGLTRPSLADLTSLLQGKMHYSLNGNVTEYKVRLARGEGLWWDVALRLSILQHQR